MVARGLGGRPLQRVVEHRDRGRGVAGQQLHVAAERAVHEVALPAQPIQVVLIAVEAQIAVSARSR